MNTYNLGRSTQDSAGVKPTLNYTSRESTAYLPQIPEESRMSQEGLGPYNDSIERHQLTVANRLLQSSSILGRTSYDGRSSGAYGSLTIDSSLQRPSKNILQFRPRVNEVIRTQPNSAMTLSSMNLSSMKLSKRKSQSRKYYQPTNPFASLDEEEKSVMEFTPTQECYESLVVTNNRRRSKYELDFLSIDQLEEASSYFYIPRPNGVIHTALGQPRSIQLGSDGVLYIGTSAGFVVRYSLFTNSIEKLKLGPDHRTSHVSVIRLFPNQAHLLVGHESGDLIVWELATKKPVLILSFGDDPILALEVLKQEPLSFLVSDASGRVSCFTMFKNIFKEYQYTETLLLNRSVGAIMDIKVIPVERVLKKGDEGCRSCHLVAMASLSVVIVMAFNPDPRIIQTFPILSYNESDTCYPYISWGWIRSQVYEFIALAIGCGKVLELVRFSIDEEISCRKVKYSVFEQPIISVEFVRTNLIYVFDSKNMLHLLNFQDLKHGNFAEYVSHQNDSRRTPLNILISDSGYYREHISAQPNTQRYVRNLQGYLPDSYHRAFCFNPRDMNIFLLCHRGFVKVHFYDPVEFLNVVHAQKKYKMFLTLAVDLLNGNLREIMPFAVPPAGLKEYNPKLYHYLNEKLLAYIYHKLFRLNAEGNPDRLTSNPAKIHEVASALIDFCLEIGFVEQLFTTIKKSFQLIKLNDNFLNALEPFILLDRVNYIPESQISEVITFFHNNGRSMTVQRLLVNLDLKRCNVVQLIHLCLQLELLMPLVHVSTKGAEGYRAPLINTMTQFNKSYTSKQFEQAGKYCNNLYWYIRLCLQNRQIYSTETIPTGAWKEVVREMLLMMFKKENVAQFLKLSPYLYLSTALLFFEERAREAIEEYQGKIVLNSGKSFQTLKSSEEVVDIYKQMYSVILSSLTDRIGFSREEMDKLSNCFYYFNAAMAEQGRQLIPESLAIDSALTIVQNPETLSQELMIAHYTTLQTLRATRTEDDPVYGSEEEFCLARRDELVLALTKYGRVLIETDESLLDEFAKAVDQSQFTSVRSFVSYIKGNYTMSIELFTYNYVPESIKSRVFEWIASLLKEFSGKNLEVYRQLKTFTISKINEIVAVNTRQTKRLLDRYFEDMKQTVIMQLSLNPEMQLNYLEQVVENLKDSREKIEDPSIIRLYLNLLCRSMVKENRKLVLQELQDFSEYYNINEILRLCKENGIKDAVIYLDERLGNIEEALALRLERFKEYIEAKIKARKPMTEQRKKKIALRCQQIVEAINKETDNGTFKQHWETFLKGLVQKLKQLNDELKDRRQYEGYSEVLGEIFQEYLYQYLLKTGSTKIFEMADSAKEIVNIISLKTPFKKFLASTDFQRNIFYGAAETWKNYTSMLIHNVATVETIGSEFRGLRDFLRTEEGRLQAIPLTDNMTDEEKCFEIIEACSKPDAVRPVLESAEKLRPIAESEALKITGFITDAIDLSHEKREIKRLAALSRLKVIDYHRTQTIREIDQFVSAKIP